VSKKNFDWRRINDGQGQPAQASAVTELKEDHLRKDRLPGSRALAFWLDLH